MPPIAVGLAGITHPDHLTQEASLYWRNLHVVFLPLLPLLALGPWVIARSVDRKLGYLAAVLGYVYACFYTALDVLAGIGAGGALAVARLRAIPGAALAFAGAYGYMQEHVYWPAGVLSMFALAAGWTLMLLVIKPEEAV